MSEDEKCVCMSQEWQECPVHPNQPTASKPPIKCPKCETIYLHPIEKECNVCGWKPMVPKILTEEQEEFIQDKIFESLEVDYGNKTFKRDKKAE